MSPKTSVYENYDFKGALEIVGADIQIEDVVVEDGKLILKASFSEDLTEKEIEVKIKDTHYYGPDDITYPE